MLIAPRIVFLTPNAGSAVLRPDFCVRNGACLVAVADRGYDPYNGGLLAHFYVSRSTARIVAPRAIGVVPAWPRTFVRKDAGEVGCDPVREPGCPVIGA